ncbi:hypothetical protein ACI68E_002802 [Malassezia pachydermatis]|uniref:Macrofage activating glycoprotein n=1 Tax=Malassezia pachydermatis TaxID=77020 RepID=A0A0M9VR73_9BASI|nr:hypothetical protein Malapachy_3609 [Malassezia pachydermatis]KOS16293.1 hypothetical protein Malapachy_3609 [Malassezia pachydermatis]
MFISARSLLCAISLASAANALVYRPANGNYRRQASSAAAGPTSVAGDVAASVSAQAAQASSSTPSPPFQYGNPSPDYPGVVATNPNGPTNPDKPTVNTPINQTSTARLASINSIDDWCTFGPLDMGTKVANQEERVVAWCTKPRNNARVIPDGTVMGAHFVKTPLYVQVMALGDFTKIGVQPGDTGGELDPHGQFGTGNPAGGNVTSNVSGKDVFYQEWMNYIGHDIMCFRVCIAGSDQATPATECQHTLDEMGCQWVMPGDYTSGVFDTCDADPAYPPGIFIENGSTSSFEQYGTGLWTLNGQRMTYTNGKSGQSTPQIAQSLPKSSNCMTTSSIMNGIASIQPATSSAAPSSGKKSSGSDSNSDSNSSSKSNSGSGSGGGSSSGANAVSYSLGSILMAAAGLVAAFAM